MNKSNEDFESWEYEDDDRYPDDDELWEDYYMREITNSECICGAYISGKNGLQRISDCMC